MNIWAEFSKLWAMYRKGEHLTRAEAREKAVWQLRCELRDRDPAEAECVRQEAKDMREAEGRWEDNGCRPLNAYSGLGEAQ